MPNYTYTITYSVGTSRNDERRYVVGGITERDLARRITGMIAKGKRVYSVERETEFAG